MPNPAVPVEPRTKPTEQKRWSALYASLGRRLGIPGAIRSDQDLLELVQGGLPTSSVGALASCGLAKEELHRLIIPRRTLTHRDARDEPLTADESDRAIAIARVTALADEVFGETDRALRWLRRSKRRLGGRAPLDVVTTDVGARIVEEMLHQIDHGIVA